MIVWVLSVWLCVSPGATGECAPRADLVFASRGDCLRAQHAERARSVHAWTRCRYRREPPPWTGAEAPV